MSDDAGWPDYDAVAALPLAVESIGYEQFSQETSSEFTRVTTVFELAGDGVGVEEMAQRLQVALGISGQAFGARLRRGIHRLIDSTLVPV
jgi:hypothetical protein